MMLTVIAATGNVHKLKEFDEIFRQQGLQAEVISAAEFSEAYGVAFEMPEETGSTFEENAVLKAEALYPAVIGIFGRRRPFAVIADDSGLAVRALNGAPGVYSARYASEPGCKNASDAQNTEKLLRVMAQIPEARRDAEFVCSMAAVTNQGVLLKTEGRLPGKITFAPKGKNGFGYDPILFIESYQMTVAEMDPELKNQISHRGKALRELGARLHGIFAEM